MAVRTVLGPRAARRCSARLSEREATVQGKPSSFSKTRVVTNHLGSERQSRLAQSTRFCGLLRGFPASKSTFPCLARYTKRFRTLLHLTKRIKILRNHNRSQSDGIRGSVHCFPYKGDSRDEALQDAYGASVLFLLVGVPAYCQRGTFGLDARPDVRQIWITSVRSQALGADIEGQVIILHPNPKRGGPGIVAGGEIRLPTDTQNHAKEFAVFGGADFQLHDLSIGVDAQVRKIYLPPAKVDNQFFVRDKMELVEIPVVLKYMFGSQKRVFIQAEGAPEFTPHFRDAGALLSYRIPISTTDILCEAARDITLGNGTPRQPTKTGTSSLWKTTTTPPASTTGKAISFPVASV